MQYAVSTTEEQPQRPKNQTLQFPGSHTSSLNLNTVQKDFKAPVATIDATTLQWELLSSFEIRPEQLELSDSTYIIPSLKWLKEDFLPYAKTYFSNYGLLGSGEGRDCDNISHAFRHLLVLANAQSGGMTSGDVPCAILKTKQTNPFGGIQAEDAYHTLILIRTDQGWQIIEPQTGENTPFNDYPNKTEASWALL